MNSSPSGTGASEVGRKDPELSGAGGSKGKAGTTGTFRIERGLEGLPFGEGGLLQEIPRSAREGFRAGKTRLHPHMQVREPLGLNWPEVSNPPVFPFKQSRLCCLFPNPLSPAL